MEKPAEDWGYKHHLQKVTVGTEDSVSCLVTCTQKKQRSFSGAEESTEVLSVFCYVTSIIFFVIFKNPGLLPEHSMYLDS